MPLSLHFFHTQVPDAGIPPEGLPPAFPSWSVPLYDEKGEAYEESIVPDPRAHPLPFPPGTRQVAFLLSLDRSCKIVSSKYACPNRTLIFQLTLAEMELVYQMFGGLKRMLTAHSATILRMRGGPAPGGAADAGGGGDDDEGGDDGGQGGGGAGSSSGPSYRPRGF